MSDQAIQRANLRSAEGAFGDASERESLTAVARGPGAFRTVVLMAAVTFVEAARRKLLWIAAIAGAAFLALFWAALHSMLQSMSPRLAYLRPALLADMRRYWIALTKTRRDPGGRQRG